MALDSEEGFLEELGFLLGFELSVLSVILIVYMGFSAITSYQSFVEYCEAYKYTLASQWFIGFKTIVAAVIPLLENQQ